MVIRQIEGHVEDQATGRTPTSGERIENALTAGSWPDTWNRITETAGVLTGVSARTRRPLYRIRWGRRSDHQC